MKDKEREGVAGLVGSNEASSGPTTADAAEFCQLEKLNILGSTLRKT